MLAVKKIEIIVDREGQKSTYHSDNVFERDPMSNVIGNEFDPFVNKPIRVDYNAQGNNASKEEVNKKFEKFWLGRTPVFYTQELWQSHIVFPELADIKPALNFSWVDSSSTNDETYTTIYTITEIKENHVKLYFQGSTTPIKSLVKQEIVTEKSGRYEGTLTVDENNYLILKASLAIVHELAYNNNGSPISVITNSIYDITNTVDDLSKK